MAAIFGIYDPERSETPMNNLNLMMQQAGAYVRRHQKRFECATVCALGEQDVDVLDNNDHVESVNGNFTIVGDIRLDNRSELLGALGLPTKAYRNDGQLVVAAYEKWGEYCAEQLLGDFAFAIWDNAKQSLFCCRDHFGARPLFYFYDSKKFVFSTTINAILAAKGIKTNLNVRKMTPLVVAAVRPLFDAETWFENVYALPSGSCCRVDTQGMKQRLYWSPSIGKELAFKNEADYAQAFQEIFFKAVGDRIQSPHPISVLLSGGLDSSGIVAVAAKILEKQNRELHTFSAVLPDAHDAVFRDERYFINQFRSFPNVKINYVTAPNQGFFSTLTTSQPAWESPRRTSRYYLYEAFNREVAQIGSKVILEGVFGELGATFYGSGAYAEMFLRGQWFGLWREFNARKKTVGASVARSFLAQVVRPLLSPYLNVYRNDEYNFFRVADHHCLQPDFADYLYTMVLPRREELKPYMNPLRPNHRENQFNAIKFLHHKDYSSPHLGENIYRYPFKDKRLLEFCLNLPLDLKVKNGYNRYSIRAGLDKILPPEIQWRTTKQPFSPDYMRRYKQQQPQVLAYLEDIRANDPVRTLIDVEKLKKWAKMPVAENEQRKDVITIAMHGLPDGIYLIHFLRRFSDFKVN